MIKIEYKVSGNTIEIYYEPNMGLAKYLANRLKETTHKLGTFKFSKV